MKEYDIYLKNRLTEGKIIVYSIPYRDGVSATDRIMLEAMLNYYTLQKFIASSVGSSLVSDIDDMLATVHERIGDSVAIQVNADFFVRYRNELEQTAMEIGVPELVTFCQSFMAMEGSIGLRVSDAEGQVKVSAGSGESGISIQSEYLGDFKRSMERVASAIGIQLADAETQKMILETVDSEIEVGLSDTDLLYRYSIAADHAFSVVAGIASIEMHYSLGDGASVLEMRADEQGSYAEKRIEVTDQIQIYCEAAGKLIDHLETDNELELTVDMSAGVKRYRTLSEMDNQSLQELDDTSLEELYYVQLW